MGFPATAGVSLFRCIDDEQHVTFSQTACYSGRVERLEVKVQNSGWIKPKHHRSKSKPRRQEPENLTISHDNKISRLQRERCWRTEQKIERIQRQLRQGYRRDQGERLRLQRREHEAYLGRFCASAGQR